MIIDSGAHVQKLIQASKDARARDIPHQQDALFNIQQAYRRLEDLGWRHITYCPKDGTEFKAILADDTNIYDCQYIGKWPEGGWFICTEDDMYPVHPILFKL